MGPPASAGLGLAASLFPQKEEQRASLQAYCSSAGAIRVVKRVSVRAPAPGTR